MNKILARSSNDSLVKRAKWLQKVQILATLSQRQLALLAGVLHAVSFNDRDKIIRQGDAGTTFYIIEEGSAFCRYEDREGEIARFSAGDYFGEMARASSPTGPSSA